MNYHILYQDSAEADLIRICLWIARRSPSRAEAWLDGALAAIDTLTTFPRRCPIAPENDEVDAEIRQLLYGEYRILFSVDEDLVQILHIQHGSQRSLTPDELE